MKLRALWAWWGLCCLFTVLLWGLSTRHGVDALVRGRELAVRAALPELRAKLDAVEKLPQALLRSRLETPFFAVYDRSRCPQWMSEMLRARPGQTTVRPMPPGMEAGRVFAPDPAGLPACYWLTCDSETVVSLNADYLYGPWLAKQLSDVEGLSGRRGAGNWTVPTFFAEDPFPFEPIALELDDRAAVMRYLAGQLLWLAAGACVLASFAYSLRLAARGLQAEKQFNAMVSHELRTPIAAISMYSEILENQWVEDEQQARTFLRIVREEATHLAHLVENLLGLGGRGKLTLTPVCWNDLVEREAAGARLELDPQLPAVPADRSALLLVLRNLVQNARRHGGGDVTVRTLCERRGVVLEVLDAGPGLPGTASGGLGLKLVQRFVEAHGGKLQAENRPEGGALFRVWLPQ